MAYVDWMKGANGAVLTLSEDGAIRPILPLKQQEK